MYRQDTAAVVAAGNVLGVKEVNNDLAWVDPLSGLVVYSADEKQSWTSNSTGVLVISNCELLPKRLSCCAAATMGRNDMASRPFHLEKSPCYWMVVGAAILGANDGIVSTSKVDRRRRPEPPPSELHCSCRSCRSRCRRHVNGGWRVCFGQLVVGYGRADIARESEELSEDPAFEHAELETYMCKGGLDEGLAKQVASELMLKDALATHLRDELGISESARLAPCKPR